MEIVQEKHNFVLNSHIWYSTNITEVAHWHDNVEIVQMLENKSAFIVDGKTIEAKKGDILVIKDQSIHRGRAESGKFCFRIVQFSNKIFFDMNKSVGDVKTYIPYEEIKKVPNLEKILNNLFEIADIEGREIYIDENPFYQFVVMAAYMALLRSFPEKESEIPVKGERNEFSGIVEYINKNFKKDINIGSISETLYISRNRLTKLFAKYSGSSINEYITGLRIKNANHMLSAGHSVTEAALDSGFQSIRTFNKVYKDYTGLTPSEYQKKQKNKTIK